LARRACTWCTDGLAFGYVGDIRLAISTKLAAQFYFKDMTVLKVMFTAIVVAMVPIRRSPLGCWTTTWSG
jgi:hypothetical protein